VNQHFRLGILTPYPRHIIAAGFLAVHICHFVKLAVIYIKPSLRGVSDEAIANYTGLREGVELALAALLIGDRWQKTYKYDYLKQQKLKSLFCPQII
jgi:hypothetical protein